MVPTKRLAALVFALFIPFAASAELTEPAKLEIQKIQRMINSIGASAVGLSDSINRDPGADRALHGPALVGNVAALNDCRQAITYMLGVETKDEPISALSRENQVTRAFQEIDACAASSAAYASMLDAVASGDPVEPADFATQTAYEAVVKIRAALSATNAPGVRASKASLDTFNKGLDYGQVDSKFAPRLVGPHGDFDSGQHFLMNTLALWTKSLAASAVSYRYSPVYPDAAKFGLREHHRYVTPALAVISRVALLDLRIVGQGDQRRITDDNNRSAGLRDEDFWRVVRQEELMVGSAKDHPQILGYRYAENGVTGSFQVGLGSLVSTVAALVEANSDAEDVLMFQYPGLPTTDALLNFKTSRGTARVMLGSAIQGWQQFDHWFFSVFGFFHGPPAPPSE